MGAMLRRVPIRAVGGPARRRARHLALRDDEPGLGDPLRAAAQGGGPDPLQPLRGRQGGAPQQHPRVRRQRGAARAGGADDARTEPHPAPRCQGAPRDDRARRHRRALRAELAAHRHLRPPARPRRPRPHPPAGHVRGRGCTGGLGRPARPPGRSRQSSRARVVTAGAQRPRRCGRGTRRVGRESLRALVPRDRAAQCGHGGEVASLRVHERGAEHRQHVYLWA